jgi:transcription-repair coupling factor (superfamily II helicase)
MAGVTREAPPEFRLAELSNRIGETGYFECIASLRRGEGATFDSVWGSSCALLAAALSNEFDHLLIVCSDDKVLDNFTDDLETFAEKEFRRFPAYLAGENTASVDFEYGERLRLVKRCIESRTPPLIIATPASLMQPVPTPESVREHTRTLTVGDQLDLTSFHRWLAKHGFHQSTAVQLPGEFASRGGITDVFAPDWDGPVRIELFDDVVESLRLFSVDSQRTERTLAEIEITLLSPEQRDAGQLASVLPANTVVLMHEQEEIADRAQSYITRSAHPENLFGWTEVQKQLSAFAIASSSRLAAGFRGARWPLPVDSVERFLGDLTEIRLMLDRVVGDGQAVVLSRTEGEIQRINEILSETRVAKSGRLRISVGCAHDGFRLRGKARNEPDLVIVGTEQLFHRSELRRPGRRRHLGKAIDSFLDLAEGDLVVHLAHGIGRFRGLQMLDKDGQHTEHLEIEFHGATRIYVPASKIDLVQKYVGGTKTRPQLAKIGGKAWTRQKQIAQRAVADLAVEMIEVQAARSCRNGIAFGLDTPWQSEFEHAFPYRETPDQLNAIEAIKSDMHAARPMDRLLCGDVGFGKTEVAMRAAFKAVENGYQVAVLVPTTVLAEQHYRTFCERMIEFPLDIVKLSRFCTAGDLRKSIERLKIGQADIAIGTHRLLSEDVQFYNLGLAIIDEEQRFGVAHKERLKSLRNSVDVLTMSATPIPRTLHMSLVGVRDISNLETPPEDRLSVETRVTRYDEELVRTAVLRELNRGGQIFFVHNRVEDILAVNRALRELIPEASIGVAHGQMAEDTLESVMTDFINGQHDVLLCTTIIESGLDIPNANTMFIDNADRFGLSDLHQLRGRVGRYKNRAYCYLLLEPHKLLTPMAAKRLRAIETFSEMGAGFAIAMRDLEIRGAGNLLGSEQSGHIAAVGYELYCHLLETAIRELKKQPARIRIDVDIDLPVSAFLPDDYVNDRRQKIDLYRRMTRLDQFDAIREFEQELIDRFGSLPPPVRRLLELSEIKLEAAVWQIQAIFLEDKYLGFRYENRARIQQLSKLRNGILRVVDDKTAYVPLKSARIEPSKLLALVKSILRTLA